MLHKTRHDKPLGQLGQRLSMPRFHSLAVLIMACVLIQAPFLRARGSAIFSMSCFVQHSLSPYVGSFHSLKLWRLNFGMAQTCGSRASHQPFNLEGSYQMADKTLRELIAEASQELHETYNEIGGLGILLEPIANPIARIQQATQDGENARARAKRLEEQRNRERDKERMVKEEEARAAERRARDEREAAELEAQLMARLRKEYPPMTDTAWNKMWPEIRAKYYHAEHERRMRAFENDGDVYGEMRGTSF